MNVKHITTINPSTEQVICTYNTFSTEMIHEKITAAQDAYLSWRNTALSTRKKLMLNMKNLLIQNKESLAEIMALEMGKPVSEGIKEIEKCAWVCEHYAHYSASYLKPKNIKSNLSKSTVYYLPMGIIFAIMPWNFPFWQVYRFAAPTLMAGNVGLLKHASITTGCGQAISQLFQESGFPNHVFQQLIITSDQAKSVIAHENIKGVTLTGSEEAGRMVASQAGQYLKKSVLELGGSDPYIILEDADLNLAAQAIVNSRLANAGQVCIAAKRIIVLEKIYQKLIHKIHQITNKIFYGNPLNSTTQMGPLARNDLRLTLQNQINQCLSMGAKLICGGKIPEGIGFYYPPTILTDITPGMPAFDDELFGPVIAIIKASDEQDAIHIANQSKFGLGAGIFTKNIRHAEQLAIRTIEAGSCYINTFVSSDPRLPFGGIKQSGYGRELSKEGILAFVNIKTVGVL